MADGLPFSGHFIEKKGLQSWVPSAHKHMTVLLSVGLGYAGLSVQDSRNTQGLTGSEGINGFMCKFRVILRTGCVRVARLLYF